MAMKPLVEKLLELMSLLQKQKFFLLNFTVVFLCFFLLPGLIINRGIEATLAVTAANEKAIKKEKLESVLDELEFFSANDRFAHFLLSSLCKDKTNQQVSLNELKAKIARLKQLFPGSFSFVVANFSGKIIKDLSDEKDYAYLYRKTFTLINDLAGNLDQESPVKAINDLEATLNRLRPLLGDVLRAQDLFLPLQAKKSGRSILASGAEKKFHIWYGKGKDFLIFTYISRSFIRSSIGLRWATERLNNNRNNIIAGFSSFPPTSQTIQPRLRENDATMVINGLARAEEVGNDSNLETANGFITTRFLNQKFRGFCLAKTGEMHKSEVGKVYAWFGQWLLILLFILYVRQLRFPIELTVKIKITAFFAYAIILPILVIGSLTTQFLQQAEAEMISNLHRRSQRLIEKIDGAYAWYKEEKATLLSRFFKEEFANDPDVFTNKSKARELNLKLSKLSQHGELMVIDNSGKDHLLGISPRLTTNSALIRAMCKEAGTRMLDADARNLEKKTSSFHLYTSFYREQNHIEYFGIGEMDLNLFLKLLIYPDFSIAYVVMTFWQESRLNEEFIFANRSLLLHPEAKLTVFNTEKRKMIIFSGLFSRELQNLCEKSSISRTSNFKKLRIDRREYIAMTMPGQKLEKIVFSALFPAEIVDGKIRELKMKATLLMLILILLSAATIYLLQNWFFIPLDELKSGIDAFSKRDFHKRLTVSSNNELGKLINAFNESFETLQDLEVARIVQESILPDPYLKLNGIEIAAKTAVMTRLGGDYFDILPQADDNILVFIGDATGHGIPAALSMAMAKSVMIHESLTGLDSTKLMQKLQSLFRSIRKTGSKDFMTASSVYINSCDGRVTIVNAGHCHPILIKAGTSAAETYELESGMPLGFGLKRGFHESHTKLESGDTLIFYTDGFYECTNQHNEMLGFDGFNRLISEARDEDLVKFSEKIFNSINEWEKSSSDDKTLIMVKKL